MSAQRIKQTYRNVNIRLIHNYVLVYQSTLLYMIHAAIEQFTCECKISIYTQKFKIVRVLCSVFAVCSNKLTISGKFTDFLLLQIRETSVISMEERQERMESQMGTMMNMIQTLITEKTKSIQNTLAPPIENTSSMSSCWQEINCLQNMLAKFDIFSVERRLNKCLYVTCEDCKLFIRSVEGKDYQK